MNRATSEYTSYMNKNSVSIEILIEKFKLLPHPEGGFFREAYRSTENISANALPSRFNGDRSFSTSIYYLLPEGKNSKLHRIKSDEVWHFYLGGSLNLECIDEKGTVHKIKLGQNIEAGEELQHVVKAGHWFGASPSSNSGFCFVGCTVSPGFDFADFEIADKTKLLAQFPNARDTIHRLL